MKILWRMSKEAKKYRLLLICAIASTLALTVVNLIAPRILSDMISLVSIGLTREALSTIFKYTMILLMLYLSKILFRFMSNYLSHKAAWKLVEELRVKVYDKLQSFSIGYYNDKQTGELMSRVTADTETVEQIYAHLLPETVTNAVTLVGVTGILLAINWRLALLTCIPIPFILISGWVFSHKVRPNFRIMQKARGEMSAQLQDNLSGIQEIQAFGQQGRASAQVHAKANKFTVGMLHALKISAVFQEDRLVEHLSAIDNIKMVLDKDIDEEEIKKQLAMVEMQGALITKPTGQLSGGQKRRVAIVRAIMAKSDFICLDEPFKGLDVETKQRVMEYVKRNLHGKTALLITHDMDERNYFEGDYIGVIPGPVCEIWPF